MVNTLLDEVRLLVFGLLSVLSNESGGSLNTFLALKSGLRTITVNQVEKVGGSVLIQSVGELIDGRGDLHTHAKDLALALETDVTRPFDEAGKITLGLDGLANTV